MVEADLGGGVHENEMDELIEEFSVLRQTPDRPTSDTTNPGQRPTPDRQTSDTTNPRHDKPRTATNPGQRQTPDIIYLYYNICSTLRIARYFCFNFTTQQ